MRKMYSEEQVRKMAGGLPAIASGDAGKALVVNQSETGTEWSEVSAPDNVLVLPESAPSEQTLVGVNKSNEQNAITIGDGLAIKDNALVTNNIYDISIAGSSSATAINNIALTVEEVALINTNYPILKLIFNDGVHAIATYVGTSGNYVTYEGICDLNSTTNIGVLGGNNGQKASGQLSLHSRFSINTSSNTATCNNTNYIKLPMNLNTISPCFNIGLTNFTSGSAITNNYVKSAIQNQFCFTINKQVAYPMYRDNSTSDVVSYYYNVISDDSNNLLETVYKITESDWVVTFVSKTIA